MKRFEDCVVEAQRERRAAERKKTGERCKREQELLARQLSRLLFLLLLAAVLGAALIRMEPVRAAAAEIFSWERIAAGMDAPESVDEIQVKELSEFEADYSEGYENEGIEDALIGCARDHGNVLTDTRVTWYTASTAECGKDDGITASGFPVCAGVTIGVDADVIPLMSDVCVEWPDGNREWYLATDTGVIGNAVDIYIEDYEHAIQNGVRSATVYWVPEGAIQ